MFASPAVANGVIYMGSNDGVIYALGAASNVTTSPSPSPTIPELPNQIFLITLVLFALTVTSATLIVRLHRCKYLPAKPDSHFRVHKKKA